MPREASKCREWEKERRDRLKTGFTLLGKLLPCYDPSITLSKADILQKAATYIEELQAKIKELLSAEGTSKTEREEISKLHSRIKKLLIRNEQLAGLVKDAGIKLPTECGTVKKFKDPRLWSNRITAEQAKLLAKKEAQKENEPKKSKCILKKSPNKARKLKSTVLPPKQRKAVRKPDFKVKNSSSGIKTALNLSIANNNLITVVSSQPCFLITNAPSNSVSQTTIKTTTVVTNSRIFSTPLVSSSVQPTPSIMLAKTNTTLKSLTPGTLIVTNGSLLPVLPQPTILPNPPLLTNSNTVINSLPTNNTTLIVVPKTNVKDSPPASLLNKSIPNSTATSKALAKLRPKIDLTRTTQVNKVPIPASRYASSFLLFPTGMNDCNTIKGPESKPVKSKLTQKRSGGGDKLKILKAKKTSTKAATKTVDKAVQQQEKESETKDVTLPENSKEKQKAEAEKIEKDDINESEPDLKKQKLSVPEECPKVSESKKTEATDTSTNLKDTPTCIEKVKDSKSDSTKNDVKSTDISRVLLTLNENQPKSSNNAELVKELVKEPVRNEPAIVENICKTSNVSKNVSTQEKQNTTEVVPLVTVSVLDKSHEVNAEKTDGKKELKNMELPDALTHSELSNDIFAHLSHVSTGGQNPESTSPTAAFLLAFPIVSSLTSLKVTEVMEEETSDSQHGTPTLLQIGTMDTTKTTQSLTDNLTPNLLNLDNFSFFSANNFYPPFESNNLVTTASTLVNSTKATVSEAQHSRYTQVNPAKCIKFCEKTETPIVTTTSHSVNVTKSYPVLNSTSSVATVTQNNVLYTQKASVTTVHNSVPSVSTYNVPLSYNQICYTNMETVTTNTTHQTMKAKQNNDKCTYYSTVTTSYSLPQYNTFNPFTDIPKSSSYTNASKAYNESSYTNNSGYSYNYSGDNFNISYSTTNKTNIKNDKSFYGLNYSNTYDYKSSENQKYESRNQQFNMYYNQNQTEKSTIQNHGMKNHTTKSLNNNNNTRQPVNWMTTPDLRQQDFLVPPFTKEMEFAPNSIYPTNTFSSTTQSTYFNSNTSLYPSADLHHNSFGDGRKLDAPFVPISANTFQRNDMDENQFSWSPSKLPQLLDPPHNFVSSTLPTLVGDLALGTTQPFTEQKIDNKNIKDNFRPKESSRRTKSHTNFDNGQSNFLSVSQLVDHSKPEVAPTRIASRRNSGNRSSKSGAPSKSNKRLQKPAESKETTGGVQNYSSNKIASDKTHNKHQASEFAVADNSNWTANNSSNNKNRETNKNAPSNYSAEALISHQPQLDSSMMKQNYSSVNKSLPVPFLTDNLISYFPPVDIPQDNSFIQQNQNYQSGSFTHHNFPSSIQSNSYSSNSFIPNTPTITTSYLPSTNFIPDLGNHDYNPVISENVFPHVGNRTANKLPGKQSEDKRNMSQNHANTNCSVNKKVKRKQAVDGGLPGLVDFSFLSMPGAINSPILPDEFHTHSNFLPPPTPTQLYPCKNPLYTKQPSEIVPSSLLPLPPTVSRTGIQHPEISPINNVGTTSLTNFNLSTIFPEINKGSAPLPNIYGDSTKAKEFLQRDFLTNPAPVQVPFSTGKSNLSMSYINSTSTT